MIDLRSPAVLEAYGPYTPGDFSALHGMKDLPDPLISAHLHLYEGYVKNLNLLLKHLHGMAHGSPEWCELQRRVGFELDGMRLHELYFENLSPGRSDPSGESPRVLSQAWGSFGAWEAEFRAMAQMRGVGWVILYRDPRGGRLSNHWIGLHDQGHPAGFTPLLVLDVWEHAFTGMERSQYIDAFFAHIDWERVDSRRGGASC